MATRTLRTIDTRVALPPGEVSGARVHELLRLIFEAYQWFAPMRYGYPSPKQELEPRRIDYGTIVSEYETVKAITVAARTDREFLMIHPARKGASPDAGALIWVTSAAMSSKSSWMEQHQQQVAELMRIVGSPLARAAISEDFDRKEKRFVPDDIGETLTFTVRDPSEGLAGLFWRNFYGAPFLQMFGERLDQLPAETRQRLGEDLVLVQPYALPTQAMTPEGEAAEQRLIQQLGPECFYDFTKHVKPTRVPILGAGTAVVH